MANIKATRKKLSDYQPDLHNANQGSERGYRFIDDSITEDGVGRSGLVDKNGVVIAGNQTMAVLAANGIEDVIEVETTGNEWVVVKRTDTDLQDDDPNNIARRMAYRDNRSVDVSLTWNPVQLQADKESGVEVVDKLWSPVELEILGVNGDEPPEDPGAQIDKAAELQEIWQVQRGDVWEIPSSSGDGVHRIMCGDSTCAEDVALLMDGVSPSMIFADPMYDATPDIVDETMKLMDNGCHVFIMGSDGLVADIVSRYRQYFRRFFVCYTPGGCPAISVYMPIVYADIMAEFLIGETSFNNLHDAFGTVIKTSKHLENLEFKAKAKRPDFIVEFIAHYTHKLDVVYDPFLGSGTTIVACEQTGRIGYGMEISPEYAAVCLERLSGMGLTPNNWGV